MGPQPFPSYPLAPRRQNATCDAHPTVGLTAGPSDLTNEGRTPRSRRHRGLPEEFPAVIPRASVHHPTNETRPRLYRSLLRSVLHPIFLRQKPARNAVASRQQAINSAWACGSLLRSSKEEPTNRTCRSRNSRKARAPASRLARRTIRQGNLPNRDGARARGVPDRANGTAQLDPRLRPE